MDDDVRKLRATLARRERGRGKRYPRVLRERIAAVAGRLRSRGASWHRIGESLGIPHETIRRYARGTGSAFAPVIVADEPASTGVLVTPSGYRVEGLSVGDLANLLARLR